MRPAALVAFAFDGSDLAVLAHAELEADVGLGPPAMGDESLLPRGHEAHVAAGFACKQCSDQLDVKRFRAAAEAAADMRFDDPDARHVYVENLCQHQMHVIRNLRTGVDGHALAHGVILRERGVHLHLVLADLGAVVIALAHEIRLAKSLLYAAQLEQDIALDIIGPMRVDDVRAGGQRLLGRVIGGQLLDFEFDEAERAFGGGIVDRRDPGYRLAAIAHLVARQRVFAARDRQHAECLVAVGACDDCLDTRQPQRRRDIDVDDLRVGIGAAQDAARQQAWSDQIGRVFRPPRYLVRPVDHRHVSADAVRWNDLVHGATPPAWSSAAYFTASMILT